MHDFFYYYSIAGATIGLFTYFCGGIKDIGKEEHEARVKHLVDRVDHQSIEIVIMKEALKVLNSRLK